MILGFSARRKVTCFLAPVSSIHCSHLRLDEVHSQVTAHSESSRTVPLATSLNASHSFQTSFLALLSICSSVSKANRTSRSMYHLLPQTPLISTNYQVSWCDINRRQMCVLTTSKTLQSLFHNRGRLSVSLFLLLPTKQGS